MNHKQNSLKKTLLVAKREYYENLATKTFWIGIFVLPIILLLSIAVPALLEKKKDARNFAVLDQSQWLLSDILHRTAERDLNLLFDANQLPETLSGTLSTPTEGSRAIQLRSMDPDAADALFKYWKSLSPEEARALNDRLFVSRHRLIEVPGTTEEELIQKVQSKELFAFIVIGPDPLSEENAYKYTSNNLTDTDLKSWFQQYANPIIQERRFEQNSIAYELAQTILTPVQFIEKQITKSGDEKQVETKDKIRQWVPVAFVYLLWIAVFSVAQMLLTNTVEEKSNRIIEVLLSSVSPLELMSGKVLGIAATGLTVVLSWVVTLLGGMQLMPLILAGSGGLDLGLIAADPLYLFSFVAYFLLGYLLYAALLVGIGAVCNSLKEAQNLMGPVTVLLMIPLLTMVPIGKDPNGMLAQILSYIPPFTPFVMMNRAAGPPELWEYFATTALLIVSIAALFWAAAKIFRIGILMTGKPPKFMEILQWLRTPVGNLPQAKEE
jgi:ABC-2 type transport system permease protein